MCARSPRQWPRLDPGGEDILFVVGSDHGMETVDETIDLDALLVDAGLKQAAGSSDVVVAPNGSAALLYFAEPDGALVGRVADFLETQPWVGRMFTGPMLAASGLPRQTAMRIALTLKPDPRENAHGVPGHSHIVRDPMEAKNATGFGQHGGLGVNEQSPFLFVSGGGFSSGACRAPTSLIDIAPTLLRHFSLAAGDIDGRPLPRHPVRSA